MKGEHDVQRPVASYDRFLVTREAMRGLQDRYAAEAVSLPKEKDRGRAHQRHLTWVRAELALVLLEATGKRRSSIVGLRWSDFDFGTNRIAWQPEHDKKRKTWAVAYPGELMEEIRSFQRRLAAVGGFAFPRHDDVERPAPRELISQWIVKAEEKAGLPKLAGGTCHPFRRKWRSERRHHPTKAVMLAGGWTDAATMDKCYDLPDDADVLAVTSETHKRREALSEPARQPLVATN